MRLPSTIVLLPWILAAAISAGADGESETSTAPGEPHAAGSASGFEIVDIDLGDQAWGLNCMKVRVRNTSDSARTLFMHIGGKSDGDLDGGFGTGDTYRAQPGDQVFEHWYWLPPCHGTIKAKVMFVAPKTNAPWAETPFTAKTYAIPFPIPNSRCNNLMISDKIVEMRTFYPPDMQRVEPFKYVKTEHFILYYSPNTPAASAIYTLAKDYEAALAEARGFFGAQPAETYFAFFYPDRLTKKMCTNHEGDCLAAGHTIAQVYNDTTQVDPCRELTRAFAADIGIPPAMFSEGLATWMSRGHLWNGTPVDVTAAQLLKDGNLVPLKALFIRTEIGAKPADGEVTSPMAASFVGYLVQALGKEKFLEVYNTLKNGDDLTSLQENVTKFEEIYSLPLEKIEAGWHGSLTQGG
ncbi:MAG: hypothetical protein WC655_24270 [Candidatus Hydrogenedentales bacterium]|jgi:hypothetical protein